MEKLKQLEDEIKYFEILNGGLYTLKSFLNEEAINIKSYLKSTYMLRTDMELGSIVNAPKMLLPFMYALMLRQLIIALRERKEYINFENIKNNEKYQSLLKDIFGENSDIPYDEANLVLTEICNRISHGEIYKIFNYENYQAFLRNSAKHEKHYIMGPIAELIYISKLSNEVGGYLNIQSKYTSRFKEENGKIVQRDTPKTVSISIDYKKLDKLIAVVMTSYLKEIEPSDNQHTAVLQFYLNGIEPMPVRVTLGGDHNQNEDFEKIRDHYSSIKGLNPNYAEIAALFGASLNPIFKVVTLANLYISFPEIFKVGSPNEIIPQVFVKLYSMGMDDMNANVAAYNFEKDNLYKEFLLTELVLLITNLENKKLYSELACTSFIENLTADLLNLEQDKITEKHKLKIIKTIRNALIHGRYVNGVETVDLYDEKHQKRDKNTKEQTKNMHLKKELEFKFGLSVEDLEDIKDLCLHVLIDNYKKELNNSNNI